MEWYIRLWYELKKASTAYFVTLTYDDDMMSMTLTGNPTVLREDIQRYFKRLRKREPNNKLIKYYANSEYGTKNGRPHYHAIILNVQDERNITRAWSKEFDGTPMYFGNVFIPPTGGVSDASIKYVTGYICKRKSKKWLKDRHPEFPTISKGIGLSFLKDAEYFRRNEIGHIIIDKTTYPLPRYLKEKTFPKTIIKTSDQLWVEYAKNALLRFGGDHGLWKKHMKHIKVSDFRPLTEKNAILQKISNDNYEKFLQAKVNTLANFDSLTSWGENRIDLAAANNPSVKTHQRIKPRHDSTDK